MNIGENIRKIRKSKNLIMKELGKKVNLSEQAISQYERGERQPNIEILNKLAKALNTPLSDLLGNDNPKQICLQAVQYFGKTSRKQLAQEECAELIQALSKDLRSLDHNVEEEIADVLIMIEQLKSIYDADKIEKYKQEKIERLNKLMENQEDKYE